MKKIKAILFDFHGTLAFTKKRINPKKICQLIRKLGYDVYHQEWEAAAKFVFFIDFPEGKINNWRDFQRKIFERLKIKVNKEVLRKVVEYCKENLRFKFYPDAKIVKKLPFKKAIVTTIPKFYFSNLDLGDFDEVITGKESGRAKPHPKCFLTALKKLEVKPEETLMVGNEIDIDIKPAEDLGINTILIDRDNSFKNYRGRKIKSLKELRRLIK